MSTTTVQQHRLSKTKNEERGKYTRPKGKTILPSHTRATYNCNSLIYALQSCYFPQFKIFIKIYLNEKNVSGNWIHVAQNRIQPRSQIHVVEKLRFQ